MNKKFYLTTPLYYVNDTPHIGHSYTQIASDVLARYLRLAGYDVFFLTGTDEHGQKMERAAKESGRSPQDFIDEKVEMFKKVWRKLHISNDDFIRTSEVRHIEVVKAVYNNLYEKGDIYKGVYEGWYCTPCETFFIDSQLVDGKCPDCSREVDRVAEESYFFRMSKYQDRLLRYIEDNPEFIYPLSRRNEILNFVKSGLRDISISRTGFKWGVPVPFDTKHVVYVWFDALLNYISACGYLNDKKRFERYWPADVHLMGKDILKFHAVIWPCMLFACGLNLPKKVFAHGWWTIKGEKMSKSKGNIVEPLKVIERYGVDAYRYFLLREVAFGLDGDFSYEALENRYNADLANNLGNLLHRTTSMAIKYYEGKIPNPAAKDGIDERLRFMTEVLSEKIESLYEHLEFNGILQEIWMIIDSANKYVEESAPWNLFKTKNERLKTVIYNLAEVLRIVSVYLYPFMPEKATQICKQLGIKEVIKSMDQVEWGGLEPSTVVSKGLPLFPRIE